MASKVNFGPINAGSKNLKDTSPLLTPIQKMEASDTSWRRRTSQIHLLTKGRTSIEKNNPCYFKIIIQWGKKKKEDGEGERDLFVLPHTKE